MTAYNYFLDGWHEPNSIRLKSNLESELLWKKPSSREDLDVKGSWSNDSRKIGEIGNGKQLLFVYTWMHHQR